MPRLGLIKVGFFLIDVIIAVAALAILSDFFLIATQTFIVERMQGMQISLPSGNSRGSEFEAAFPQFIKGLSEKGELPDRRTVQINMGETSASIDFSFVIEEDHPLAGPILDGINPDFRREFVSAVFGDLVFSNALLQERTFQSPSIDIDTKSKRLTVHFPVMRIIEKNTEILFVTNAEPGEAGNQAVTLILNYEGRKLIRVSPFPAESAKGMIQIDVEPSEIPYLIEVETEILDTTASPTLAEFTSRQTLLQTLGDPKRLPFLTSLLESILEALPLLFFVGIVWTWKGEIPACLRLLLEVMLALLAFHFVFYLVNVIKDLVYQAYGAFPTLARFQADVYNPLYQAFRLLPPVNTEPLGFLSVGTAMMSILIPALLIRRSQKWDGLKGGQVSVTAPFQPGNPSAPGDKFLSRLLKGWSIFTYSVIVVLIAFPLVYYFYFRSANDFLHTGSDAIARHLLLASFLVGVLGTALMALFRGLYHRLDGKPVPAGTVPLAFWVIFLGNLIWSFSFGLEMSVQRDVSVQAGWGWLVYATLLGAALVFALLHLVYALARQAKLVPQMNTGTSILLGVLAILSAIPMRLLFSSSAPAATYYEVLNLASELDNLIKFIFLAGLTWFFHEKGKDELALSPLTIAIGLIAGVTVFYPSVAHWLFIPLTFILGYAFLRRYLRTAGDWHKLQPLHTRVFKERKNFLEEMVQLNAGERAYQALYKSLSAKMSSEALAYSKFKKQLEARRKELDDSQDKARVGGKEIKDVALAFGPQPTAWENGVHGAFWAALFSLPWISVWIYNFMIGEAIFSAYPLWSFLVELLNLLIRWLGIGFFFGYFYPFLQGKNGLHKGIWLWLVIVIPALPLALVNNNTVTDWQGFLFWVLQVFIHCMLLGLIAFDYMTLRQGYRDWQMLFELHGIPSVGVSVSTILIAVGTAVTTLFQAQTQEIITTALSFILPNADTIASAGEVLSKGP